MNVQFTKYHPTNNDNHSGGGVTFTEKPTNSTHNNPTKTKSGLKFSEPESGNSVGIVDTRKEVYKSKINRKSCEVDPQILHTAHLFVQDLLVWAREEVQRRTSSETQVPKQNRSHRFGLVVFGIICILFGKKDNKYEGKYWTLVFFSWGRNPILLEQPLDRLSREVEMSENTIDEKNSFSGFESTWICTPNFKRKRKTSNRWSRC